MGHFASGVTVVTTRLGDELFGMTASAVASLSLDPPLVLIAVDKNAQIYKPIKDAGFFALNILSAEQEHLSRRFATRGPKEFGDLALSTAVTGAPLLEGSLAYVDCRVHDVLPGGDHDIFAGLIVAGDARE